MLSHIRLLGHYFYTPYLLMSACEAVIIVAAAYLGHFLRYWELPGREFLLPALAFSGTIIVAMVAMGVYESRIREGFAAMMLRTAVAIFLLGSLATAVLSYAFQTLIMSRGELLISAVLAFTLVGLWRWMAFVTIDEDALKKRVIVLGVGNRALKIASRMRRKADRRGFKLVGYVPAYPDEENLVAAYDGAVFRHNMTLLDFCREYQIDEIVVATDERRRSSDPGTGVPLDDLIQCRIADIDICDIQHFIEREAQKVDVDLLRPGWLAFADGFVMRVRYRALKRIFDIVASVILLLITWPIMLMIAIAIRFESKGSVLYLQERVGRDGRVFRLMKFRSMYVTESDDSAQWTRQNDPRVTRVGSFIRKSRLDELPQLFNVLGGSMSFVGPRPERPMFVAQLSEKLPFYDQRHRVKPGITGWAQLCYPYGASVADAKEKLQYDLYYLKNNSLFLDLIILVKTVEVVLIGEGAR
jgi:sugar transferase (PEP-CTERM system associated)